MTDTLAGRQAHLVGSIPLADAATVFTVSADSLGSRVSRLPDGETGERSHWIAWQLEKLAACPQLELAGDKDGAYATNASQIRIKPDCTPEQIQLGDLGYRGAALASYNTFLALRQQGLISASCRFQVSLPTPLAPIQLYVHPDSQPGLEPVYEQTLLSELRGIVDAIPNEDLAIQWDTAVEFGVLEGVFPSFLRHAEQDIIERLLRLGNAVPEDAELGFHLCYGDAGHKHFIEPADASKLVNVANAVSRGLHRPLQWLHLPVPKQRTDDDYFRPLTGLSLPPETQLFLGLIHASDGLEGAQARITTATRHAPSFGVATECGFGRRPAESVAPLLELHRTCCDTM